MTKTNNTAKHIGYVSEGISAFKVLDMLNVNEFTEKKGQFTYLSWAYAVREMLRVDAKATWEVHEYEQVYKNKEVSMKQPYMNTPAGCFVKVTVTVQDIPRTQVHPVLDHKNQTIEKPNAFQINTSIQRCLAKAIALHGLGLYIYAGEDLPKIDPLNGEQRQTLLEAAKKISKDQEDKVSTAISKQVVNQTNYKGSLAKLERMAKNAGSN